MNSLSCESRDESFDEIVDAVDGRIVSFALVGYFAIGGFLAGGLFPA